MNRPSNMYTICNRSNQKVFRLQCEALEKRIPELLEDHTLLTDVDGSSIHIYNLGSKRVKVVDDVDVDAVYIESDIDLDALFSENENDIAFSATADNESTSIKMQEWARTICSRTGKKNHDCAVATQYTIIPKHTSAVIQGQIDMRRRSDGAPLDNASRSIRRKASGSRAGFRRHRKQKRGGYKRMIRKLER